MKACHWHPNILQHPTWSTLASFCQCLLTYDPVLSWITPQSSTASLDRIYPSMFTGGLIRLSGKLQSVRVYSLFICLKNLHINTYKKKKKPTHVFAHCSALNDLNETNQICRAKLETRFTIWVFQLLLNLDSILSQFNTRWFCRLDSSYQN